MITGYDDTYTKPKQSDKEIQNTIVFIHIKRPLRPKYSLSRVCYLTTAPHQQTERY